MSKAEVLYPDGYSGREEESEMKGWLGVKVRLASGELFALTFYDPTRLGQEIDTSVSAGNPYFAEPGMVVVDAVTPASVQRAVDALVEDHYFESLKAER